MYVIKFKECNVTFAEGQPEYLPLPAYRSADGIVTSCWKLSFWERIKVVVTGRMYLQILSFNRPLLPLKMSTSKPLIGVRENKDV